MKRVKGVASWAGTIVWILGLLVFISGGFGVIAALIGYTLVFGETAAAEVTTCANAGVRGRSTDCSGTWVTDDGDRGSGHISGVGPHDIGRSVDVRIGPLGPYAEPVTGYWQIYTVLPAVGWLGYLGVRRRRDPGDVT